VHRANGLEKSRAEAHRTVKKHVRREPQSLGEVAQRGLFLACAHQMEPPMGGAPRVHTLERFEAAIDALDGDQAPEIHQLKRLARIGEAFEFLVEGLDRNDVLVREGGRLEELGASNAGFAKEIDHLLTRVAEIEKHLGIDKRIAA
jgi:hypothetical protein